MWKSFMKICSKCEGPAGVRNLNLTMNKKYVKKKKKGKNVNASTAHLLVLGSGAPDQPASVVLRATDANYLFNCGEGFSRSCQHNGLSVKSVKNVFFTQAKWQHIGGVTSLLFATIADSGFMPTILGPIILEKIIKRISFLSTIGGIFKHRIGDKAFIKNERFEDHKIIIDPIELKFENDKVFVYVCTLKACKGAFSLKKSINKNVPPHLLVILHRRESVTLDDGTVVTPEEVHLPDNPEVTFIVMDIPHEGFLDSLERNEDLKNVQAKTKSNGVEVIVHFTPNSILTTQKYQQFMKTIAPKRNLVVNDSNRHSNMEKNYLLQSKLHKIDSKLHPRLSMPLDPGPECIFNPNMNWCQKLDEKPRLYNIYHFRTLKTDDAISNDFESDVHDECQSDNEEGSTVLEKRPEDNILLFGQNVPSKLENEKFPRFLFLGTGAADSFIYRNSSGILVHLSKDHSILLDCGSGICGQINRFYGDEAPEIYRRIKAAYVSHMHLDHHIGLPELFRWRKTFLPKDRQALRVFGPIEDLKSWLLFYSNHVESIKSDVKFIDNDYLLKDKLNYEERVYLNVNKMQVCPVDHFRKSYAFTMDFPYKKGKKMENFKLAYSGDTGPSDDFVKLGLNADLLIHEATFQDELEEIAKKHHHSTISSAIIQSRRMRPKSTILTHFSSRYHIMPYIVQDLDTNTGIAFDFMEVTPGDFPRLSSLYKQYQVAFPGVAEALRRKTLNYEWSKSE